MHSHVDYGMKKNIVEYQLISLGNSCCYMDCHCADVYVIRPLVRSGLFVPVQDWCRSYQLSRILFLLTSTVMEYFLSPVISRQAPQLIFCIAFFELCVCAFMSFILSALVGRPARLSNDLVGFEYISDL